MTLPRNGWDQGEREVAAVPVLDWNSLLSAGAMIGHLSYVLIIVAMLMDRLVYLRLLAIGSGLAGLVYSTFWLYDPVAIGWEILFILAIVYQMTVTAYHNRMSRFSAEQTFFRQAAVPRLSAADCRRLFRIARIGESPADTVVATEGKPVDRLIFILSGEIDILSGTTSIARCRPGDFIGEISVTNATPATASAVALSPIRYLAFEAEPLRRLIAKERDVAEELQLAFRIGIRDKLVLANKTLAGMR